MHLYNEISDGSVRGSIGEFVGVKRSGKLFVSDFQFGRMRCEPNADVAFGDGLGDVDVVVLEVALVELVGFGAIVNWHNGRAVRN